MGRKHEPEPETEVVDDTNENRRVERLTIPLMTDRWLQTRPNTASSRQTLAELRDEMRK